MSEKYYLISLIIIFLSVMPFFLHMEKRGIQAREAVVYAIMCAVAVISRAVFAALPSVKPMVGIIMITGMTLGAKAGFLVGVMSGFVSNFIFGQGPWTPWQMFAYGVAGLLAGILARKGILQSNTPIRNGIAGAYIVLLVVGPVLDTCTIFTVMTTYTIQSVGVVYIAGIPHNIAHALATAVTMGILSKPIMETLERVQIKYGMERHKSGSP